MVANDYEVQNERTSVNVVPKISKVDKSEVNSLKNLNTQEYDCKDQNHYSYGNIALATSKEPFSAYTSVDCTGQNVCIVKLK